MYTFKLMKTSDALVKTAKVLALSAAAAFILGAAKPAQAHVRISFGIGVGVPLFCPQPI